MSTAAPPPNGNGMERRVGALEAGFESQGRQLTSIDEKVDRMASAVTSMVAARGTFNYQSIGIVIAIGAVIWAAIRVQFQADLTSVTSEQATSRAERTENRMATERVAKSTSENREDMVAMKAALTEIESQFRALENYLNLMRADQLRVNGLLWKKEFGEDYPAAAFYPSISRTK